MTGETIRVIYRCWRVSGCGESPDVEGWSAVAHDFATLRQLAIEGTGLPIGSDPLGRRP